MQRMDAASCTFIGIATVSWTASAPGLWNVYAPPLQVRSPGVNGSRWCGSEVVCHTHERRHDTRRWKRCFDARRKARRPEEALLDGVREDFEVELIEAGAIQVRAAQRSERGLTGRHAGVRTPELEVS